MHLLSALLCYLHGEYTLLPDAKISVMDSGFVFGDSVSEVVLVYGGKVLRPPKDKLVLEGMLSPCNSGGLIHKRKRCLVSKGHHPHHFTTKLPVSKPTAPASPVESLIVYPSQFPIKVMGNKVEGLVHSITQIAKAFDPMFDASTIELRESKGGKYLGVTITITATSREQLDELYRTLSTHPMVKVVL
jgi:uncharacterized protein